VVDARTVALDALVRIEEDDAYANLALGAILERSKLDGRDRGFVTELVYGVTRMRRACDFLVDRFLVRPLDVPTRNLLRLRVPAPLPPRSRARRGVGHRRHRPKADKWARQRDLAPSRNHGSGVAR